MKAILLCALLLAGGCTQQVTRTESPRGVAVRAQPKPEPDHFAIARVSPSDNWWSITSTRTGYSRRLPDMEKGMNRLIEDEGCKIQKIVPIQHSGSGRGGLKGYTDSLLVQCVPDRH